MGLGIIKVQRRRNAKRLWRQARLQLEDVFKSRFKSANTWLEISQSCSRVFVARFTLFFKRKLTFLTR